MKTLSNHPPVIRDYLAFVRRWANQLKSAGKSDAGLVLDNLKVTEHPELGITSVVVGETEVMRVETHFPTHGPSEVQAVLQPFLVYHTPDPAAHLLDWP